MNFTAERDHMMAAACTVDITPPDGIYLHNWSYCTSPQSTGVHRPLEAKLVSFLGAADTTPSLLIALDLGWWMDAADEWALRGAILEATRLPEENLVVALTHTHAGPSIARADGDLRGGEFIAPYLDDLQQRIPAAAADLLTRMAPCTLDWEEGSCHAAMDRDLYLVEEHRQIVGVNLTREADHTLIVGRLTNEHEQTVAVIANYAMHATTLGGENTLISPDFIGKARELVEQETGAPFLFLQGASGDLSPREQYVANPAIADKHGATLGHAVLSVLSAMLAPGTTLVYDRTIESGAPLGIYASRMAAVPDRITITRIQLELETQSNAPPVSSDARVQADRELRANRVRSNVSTGTTSFPVTIWDIGATRIIAYPGEAYSALARTLRREFPDLTLVFVNLANGAHLGYLPSQEAYDEGRYSAWQSPLARGSLEQLIDAVRAELVPAPAVP